MENVSVTISVFGVSRFLIFHDIFVAVINGLVGAVDSSLDSVPVGIM